MQHNVLNGILLDEREAREVLQHLADLWGYDVHLKEVDPATGKGREGAQRQCAGDVPAGAVRMVPKASAFEGRRQSPRMLAGERARLACRRRVRPVDVPSIEGDTLLIAQWRHHD